MGLNPRFVLILILGCWNYIHYQETKVVNHDLHQIRFSSHIKLKHHHITELLFKAALTQIFTIVVNAYNLHAFRLSSHIIWQL